MGNLEFEIFGRLEMLIGLAGFESGILRWVLCGREMNGVNQLQREKDIADFWFHTILLAAFVYFERDDENRGGNEARLTLAIN